jgi:hypothetical protein
MIMKTKLIAITAALLFSVAAANAQANFGVKGGLNLYKIGVDDGDKTDMKAGLHLGMLAHIHMTDHFALQPEVVYSMQGAKSEVNGDERKVNLNYVNVPLLFQYMFDNGFRLQAGPQIGILASAKNKVGGDTDDVKSGYNSLDFSVPFGVGYVAPSGFGVDARYNVGLSNIHEDDNNKAFNRGLQLGVFYQFQHD